MIVKDGSPVDGVHSQVTFMSTEEPANKYLHRVEPYTTPPASVCNVMAGSASEINRLLPANNVFRAFRSLISFQQSEVFFLYSLLRSFQRNGVRNRGYGTGPSPEIALSVKRCNQDSFIYLPDIID